MNFKFWNKISNIVLFAALAALTFSIGRVALAQTDLSVGTNLTIQRVFGIITGLVCYFSQAAMMAIVIALVFYGIKFATSRGNPEAFTAAKKGLQSALVGAIIILGTYTIIATVANAAGSNYSVIPLDCSSTQ